MGCFSFVWLRSSEAERNDRTVVNKVPFGTLEPYGDRARRREGFEPHDLRVIASRPSSSRVVLRARQAALPKLALWKTPLAKTPCPWRFGFADPTSHARRSHNPKALCQNFNLQIKKTRDTLRCLLFSLSKNAHQARAEMCVLIYKRVKKEKKAKKSEGWLSLHFLFANFLRFMAANLSLTQLETWARPR